MASSSRRGPRLVDRLRSIHGVPESVRLCATLALLFFVCVAFAGTAGGAGGVDLGATVSTDVNADEPHVAEVEPPDSGCFAGDGRTFSIGTQGPQIGMRLHLSALTDLGNPGSVGVELAGSTGEYEVVHLVAGVEFRGVENRDGFLANPFEAFALVYSSELRLPMFADAGSVDPVHTEDEPPVEGPVGVADC